MAVAFLLLAGVAWLNKRLIFTTGSLFGVGLVSLGQGGVQSELLKKLHRKEAVEAKGLIEGSVLPRILEKCATIRKPAFLT